MCEHLQQLENELTGRGISITCRGQPWSENCREWVYFDCVLDLQLLREQFKLDECVTDHTNNDPRSGLERGFYCELCHDAIMGRHPNDGTFHN